MLSIFLVGLLAAGGRRFTEELEHFLEELPGRMEELSLLGQQFEQSIERVLHLPAGKIGQLFRGTGLQGGGQVKEILLPQLLQKSVPAAAGIVRAVIVVVLFFIASILSLQENDRLGFQPCASCHRKAPAEQEIHIIFWAESESGFWMPCRSSAQGRRWCRGVFFSCLSGSGDTR